MLRLIGFFILVFMLMGILQHVPIVGAVFRIPFLGFWVTAILLSVVLSRLAVRTVDRRRFTSLQRQLGAVETPHNQGKLGMLLLNQGQYRRAIPQLQRACEGEPDSAEWHYRLGCALLGARRPEDAIATRRPARTVQPLERQCLPDRVRVDPGLGSRLDQHRLVDTPRWVVVARTVRTQLLGALEHPLHGVGVERIAHDGDVTAACSPR